MNGISSLPRATTAYQARKKLRMSARARCVAAMASGAVAGAGLGLDILFWRCGVYISTGGVYLFTRWYDVCTAGGHRPCFCDCTHSASCGWFVSPSPLLSHLQDCAAIVSISSQIHSTLASFVEPSYEAYLSTTSLRMILPMSIRIHLSGDDAATRMDHRLQELNLRRVRGTRTMDKHFLRSFAQQLQVLVNTGSV